MPFYISGREISEALERFTNLMEKIYVQQPYKREVVRLIMALVGRGGQGDVGQRIRDEILVIQVYSLASLPMHLKFLLILQCSLFLLLSFFNFFVIII